MQYLSPRLMPGMKVAYQTDKASVSPLIYFLATVVVIAVGFISVIYQTLRAANYNPAQALRVD